MMKVNTKRLIIDTIEKAARIAITSHIRPDADSIGSGLALYFMLKQKGKDVHYFNIDRAPFPLTELPGFERIQYGQIYPQRFDIVILVEGGTEERTGMNRLDEYFTINIDHHATGCFNSNINWVIPTASAAAELVYDLAHEMGIQWTRDIGFNIYAAISSDTGSFKYSNTTAKSLRIAAELVKQCNFSPAEVSDILFYSNHLEKVHMIQKVLSTLELHLNNRVSIIFFKREFLSRLTLKDIETEDIISIARSIRGVEVTLFFKEIEDNHYRVSIRSRGEISSQTVAKVFKGGGHAHAAGFFYLGDLTRARTEILRVIQTQLNK
ncbi:MAG: DHH family phosphoesterase [Candidatus Omnitrophota bacterium]